MSIADEAARHDRKIRDWLVGIVRFAVTLDEADRSSVLAMAQEMDGLGNLPGRASFQYFARLSTAVCGAIADRSDPGRILILRRLVSSITDGRLRTVMIAAVALDAAYPSARQDVKRVLA
jgi:hypothetical protein